MPKVTYVEFNGPAHVVDVPVGNKVMEGAVSNGIPGIEADCGGSCACATCHVYVDEAWRVRTGKMSADERAMLECASDLKENSRLSCQMVVTEELDGLIVRMPKSQRG
jgi:ferredoxin, 2Fe-2S